MKQRRFLKGFLSFLVSVAAVFSVAAAVLYSLPSIGAWAGQLALFSAVQTLQGDPAVLIPKTVQGPADPVKPEQQTNSEQQVPSTDQEEEEPYVEEVIGTDVMEQDLAVSAESGKVYSVGAGFLKNYSTLSKEEILDAVQADPPFHTTKTSDPQVLIIHTHTTESYYGSSESFRSTDRAQNMAAVGDEIVKELEKKEIGVIHDTEFYDYPSYNGGYARSAESIKKYLAQYPSIKIVLDVHRDALGNGNSKTAPTAVVDGNKVAQIMVVSNCTSPEKNNLPNFKQNLNIAARLQNALEGQAPGITRPILFSYRDYNQALSAGCLLVEVGGHANTLQQARWAGKYLGKALAQVVFELQE